MSKHIHFNRPTNPKTKPNYFYAIASVSFVLFLLGIFGSIVLYAGELVQHYKEHLEIMVELKDDANPMEVTQFRNELAQMPFTRAESVTYTSKEDAYQLMQSDFKLDIVSGNPFYNTINFSVKGQYMERDSLAAIAERLKKRGYVNDVFYVAEAVDRVSTNIRNVSLVVLSISLIFIFIAISLINNTIRLALYSNRFLIKNMQLVGASWQFIMRPYLQLGYRNGLISGICAAIALSLMVFLVHNTLPEIRDIFKWERFAGLLLFILCLGVLISAWSTRRCVNKYLRVRLEELY
jgi:cell division transport system permease protein